MIASSIRYGLSYALLAASVAFGAAACGGDPTLMEDRVELAAEEQIDTAEQPVVMLGTVTHEDKIASGWMYSEATLRDDGVVVGWTELKTSDSVFGFTGQTAIVLVDANKQPLTHVVAGSWGINACFFKCPRTRTVYWSPAVSADEWAYIKPDVRGMAIIHRHDPKGNFIDWIWEHLPEIAAAAALF